VCLHILYIPSMMSWCIIRVVYGVVRGPHECQTTQYSPVTHMTLSNTSLHHVEHIIWTICHTFGVAHAWCHVLYMVGRGDSTSHSPKVYTLYIPTLNSANTLTASVAHVRIRHWATTPSVPQRPPRRIRRLARLRHDQVPKLLAMHARGL
jgi:hypothetical protein